MTLENHMFATFCAELERFFVPPGVDQLFGSRLCVSYNEMPKPAGQGSKFTFLTTCKI